MHAGAPPLFIIFDAAAGDAEATAVRQRVVACLQAAGRRVEAFLAGPADDLAAQIGRAVNAARDAHGVVVAAGDDHTLNAVAQAVWNANLALGVLPRGEPGHFARAHGIPADTDQAVDTLLRAQAVPVTVGQVAERLFLVQARVGLYPPWPDPRGPSTHRHARPMAWLAGLGSLLRGRSLMTLELHSPAETRVVRTRTLFVGHDAWQWPPTGGHQPPIEEGRLVAVTLQPQPLPRTLWLLARGALGQLDGSERADRFVFDRLLVPARRGARSVMVAIDGENLRLPLPLVVQPAPRPLQLLRPPAASRRGPRW